MNVRRLRPYWHLIGAGVVIVGVVVTIAVSGALRGIDSPTAAPSQTAAPAAVQQPAAAPAAAPTVTTYRLSAVSSNGIALVLADDPQYKTRTPLHGIGGVSWEDVPASASGVSIQVISQTGDGVSCTITAKATGKVVARQTVAPAHGQGAQSVECDMP